MKRDKRLKITKSKYGNVYTVYLLHVHRNGSQVFTPAGTFERVWRNGRHMYDTGSEYHSSMERVRRNLQENINDLATRCGINLPR